MKLKNPFKKAKPIELSEEEKDQWQQKVISQTSKYSPSPAPSPGSLAAMYGTVPTVGTAYIRTEDPFKPLTEVLENFYIHDGDIYFLIKRHDNPYGGRYFDSEFVRLRDRHVVPVDALESKVKRLDLEKLAKDVYNAYIAS